MNLAAIAVFASAWASARDAAPVRGECRVEGRIVDAHHDPVAGARVVLGELGHSMLFYNTPEQMFATTPGIADADRARFAAELRTDTDGRFHAAGLSDGEFSVIAADATRGIAVTSFRCGTSAPPSIELALEASASLEAEIAGAEFDPRTDVLELDAGRSGANVQFVPRLAQREHTWSFTSSALPASVGWRVLGTRTVEGQDYRATLFAASVSIAAGEHRRISIDLVHGLELSGDVVDELGQPLAGVSVVARELDGDHAERGAITDALGRYRIRGLSPGKHALDVARWKMREIPGCGNGAQDLSGRRVVDVPLDDARAASFRLARLHPAPAVGDLAPEFRAQTLDGRSIAMSDLRGKVVLIDFWATWCGLCRMELPALVDVYRSLAPDGKLEIVGVSVDTDTALVPRFVASRDLRWLQTALGPAAENPIARLYNVSSTPSTVLVDAAGHVAAINLTGDPLRKKIEELVRTR